LENPEREPLVASGFEVEADAIDKSNAATAAVDAELYGIARCERVLRIRVLEFLSLAQVHGESAWCRAA
jgi:hypothetical protein